MMLFGLTHESIHHGDIFCWYLWKERRNEGSKQPFGTDREYDFHHVGLDLW